MTCDYPKGRLENNLHADGRLMEIGILKAELATLKFQGQIAWAAGLFEGEGTIFAQIHKSHRRPNGNIRLRMELTMTQEEPVTRFMDVVGVGAIVTGDRGPARKPVWKWQTSSDDSVRHAIKLLMPFLSKFRRDQAEAAILARDEYNMRRKHLQFDASPPQGEEGGASPTPPLQ